MSDSQGTPPSSGSSPMPVPEVLRDLASWAWRVLVLIVTVLALFKFMNRLAFVMLPLFAALLATSLAYPMVRWLRGRGANRALATWITVLLAAVVFGGISIFVVNRAIAGYPDLVAQTKDAVNHFRNFLTHRLHVKSSSTASATDTINKYLDAHSSSLAAGALTGITTVAEGLAAFVLWFFMTFFLLYDGDNIWHWIVRLFPASARDRVLGSGDQAWDRLAGFVRGTFIIAVIHAIVAAVALAILGVPLVAPLALLVFIGSFLPIVGSIVVGILSVGITLVTKGSVAGVILAAILLADNQMEAHVLQPFLVGRYVRLHPLVVAIAIASGGVLEGVAGAILAVPFVAVMYAVIRFLVTGEDQTRPPRKSRGADPPPDDDPSGGATADPAAASAAPDPGKVDAKIVPEVHG